MGDLGQWFNSIPLLTRTWFGGTIAFSLLGKFGLLNPYWMILDYNLVFSKFQIWRPITSLLFYPISPGTGFHFLINLYFLYSYSLRLETGQYGGRPADYLFALIFMWLCSTILGLLSSLMVLMDPMVMAVLYVWCQLNKDTIVSFWFGTMFKAMYLPWVLFLFNMILAGGGIMELYGIVVGHLYYFLVYKYPQEFGGPLLLQTPTFLYQYFPNERHMGGFGNLPRRPAAAPENRGGRLFRGQGHTLRD